MSLTKVHSRKPPIRTHKRSRCSYHLSHWTPKWLEDSLWLLHIAVPPLRPPASLWHGFYSDSHNNTLRHGQSLRVPWWVRDESVKLNPGHSCCEAPALCRCSQCVFIHWIFLFPFRSPLRASLVAQRLKRLPGLRETWVWSLGEEDPLEKEMATHSSILAWRIPWREEPGGLQSTGSQRVGPDWATSLSLFTLIWGSWQGI